MITHSLHRCYAQPDERAYVVGQRKGTNMQGNPYSVHIRPSKPFTKEQAAWAVTTDIERADGTTFEDRTLFRSRAHASAWYTAISGEQACSLCKEPESLCECVEVPMTEELRDIQERLKRRWHSLEEE